jgi:hypothetical protein
MSLHFYSILAIASTVLCAGPALLVSRFRRSHFGGVSLRAIDAAANLLKRMIALTEYIRFIFIQEEAWGFRPTPSMWAKSLIG